MSQKRPSTLDIAKLARVSVGTVSNVVNGKRKVREDYRNRVLAAMEELDWQPNALAQGLRRIHSSIIAMILSDISNPFFPTVVRGVEDVLSRFGYRMLLSNTDNNARTEVEAYSDMRAFNPGGFLVIPSPESRLDGVMRATRRPLVYVDRKPEGWTGDSVVIDNEGGAYQAMNHLLRSGHRRFGLVTGPMQLPIIRERMAGVERACAEFGVEIGREFRQECEYNRQGGHMAARNLLNLLPRPTAIFAFSDLIAAGTVQAIREAGLKCPDDVSVVGFGNIEATELMEPSLTTIHQSGYQMGVRAAQLLLDRIENMSHKPEQIVLPTELRVRYSTLTIKPEGM